MKCIICRDGEAVVPDRNTMSQRKRICRKCHGERLKSDLEVILENHRQLVDKFKNRGNK